ncbi:MAG: hypothetical protein EBR86_06920 [Planctomycetia bacterium]|nr:hypothetical protein [Planctomycetia bacterium]
MTPFQSDRSAAADSWRSVGDQRGEHPVGRGVAGRRADDQDAPGEGLAVPARSSCPACGGQLIEIRAKLVCSRCRTICETCCEGGPG